ncbi:MAG: hypothetical protein A3H44_14605 [Gammaproteobacteria bacterium RIFCSPLOWO2_02_FULL_57_10]|nr:MAG: hypothetical protein A3H44_14605 [Gammaproteobacteria bacterium RIFCSPLOWO2_02_FULL_57_10]
MIRLSLALLLFVVNIHAFASPWVTGTARSATDNSVLYREFHYLAPTQEPLSGRVEYMTDDDRLIAHKDMDYSRSLTAPAVEQLDIRTQTRFFTRYAETTLQAGFQRGGSALETRTYTPADDLVIDAGFDPYVRSHWTRLLSGRSVTALFHVPSRLESLRISIVPVERQECAQASGEILCLLIRPAGLLRVVGWFLEPLYLAYDLETRRLQMFKGTSNLADDDGRPQSVVILYEYAENLPGQASR